MPSVQLICFRITADGPQADQSREHGTMVMFLGFKNETSTLRRGQRVLMC